MNCLLYNLPMLSLKHPVGHGGHEKQLPLKRSAVDLVKPRYMSSDGPIYQICVHEVCPASDTRGLSATSYTSGMRISRRELSLRFNGDSAPLLYAK